MTITTLNYLNLIGAIGCFIIPAGQLIFNKDKRGLKRITSIGWCFLLVSIYIGIIGCLSINAAEIEKHTQEQRDSIKTKTYIDSLSKFSSKTMKMLAEYGLKVDATNGRLVKSIDSIAKDRIGTPLMSGMMADSPFTGAYYTYGNDTVFIHFKLCNYGTSEAFDVNTKTYYFKDNDEGKIVFITKLASIHGVDISINPCCNCCIAHSYGRGYNKNNIFYHSDNHMRYILIIGTAKNKNKVPFKIKVSYAFDPISNEWVIYSNLKDLEDFIPKNIK